jgi:hypothetical protein
MKCMVTLLTGALLTAAGPAWAQVDTTSAAVNAQRLANANGVAAAQAHAEVSMMLATWLRIAMHCVRNTAQRWLMCASTSVNSAPMLARCSTGGSRSKRAAMVARAHAPQRRPIQPITGKAPMGSRRGSHGLSSSARRTATAHEGAATTGDAQVCSEQPS